MFSFLSVSNKHSSATPEQEAPPLTVSFMTRNILWSVSKETKAIVSKKKKKEYTHVWS